MSKIEFPSGQSGGDIMLVKSGGLIEVQPGGRLVVEETEINGDTLALNGLTASAAELNILDGATVTTAEVNKLDGAGAVVASGTAAAFQADLAVDANGTAIAAAVNGLRDALVAFGMMASE